MTVRVAINGFGRIGRCVTRIAFSPVELSANQNPASDAVCAELVAINDLSDDRTLAHLLKYDSVHRRFPAEIQAGNDELVIAGKKVKSFAEPDPQKLPWKELGIDVVLECTGRFVKRDLAAQHLEAGARKVILSAPAKGDIDATLCMGINPDTYDPGAHHVLSNASCTTNCLAPIAKVMHETFGIEHGMMTTIHSFTGDQVMLDAPHSDLRRARAGTLSMIPTSTGAAKAIGLVLPELQGKLDGFAVRVPTPNVSLVDLTVELKNRATKDSINQALRNASETSLQGILRVSAEPLVSSDYIGERASSCADLASTLVVADRCAKVVAWYDNEMGYSARLWDLCKFVAGQLPATEPAGNS